VQCTASNQCRGGTECAPATCDSSGMCVNPPKAARQRCATGVCDDSGRCVECWVDDDCTGGEFAVCQGDHCVNGPGCGNGELEVGEECDPKMPGWDTTTCDSQCRTLVYAACDFNAGGPCPAGWFCGPHGGCSKACSGPNSNECSFPGYDGACRRFDNTDPSMPPFYDCAIDCTEVCKHQTSCITWGPYRICGTMSLP
jgi:hypothetical protein